MAKPQTIASNKYNAKAYDRIAIQVKKGERERLKQIAEADGKSLNAFFLAAVEEYIAYHGL